jgi:hypothetical protein
MEDWGFKIGFDNWKAEDMIGSRCLMGLEGRLAKLYFL